MRKSYTAKPEFKDLFGPESDNAMSFDELKRLAADWDKPVQELRAMCDLAPLTTKYRFTCRRVVTSTDERLNGTHVFARNRKAAWEQFTALYRRNAGMFSYDCGNWTMTEVAR